MRNPRQNDFVSKVQAVEDFDIYGDVEDEKSRRRRRLENKVFDGDDLDLKPRSKRKGRRDQSQWDSDYDY